MPRIQLQELVLGKDGTGPMLLQFDNELIDLMLGPFHHNGESRPTFVAGSFTLAPKSYSDQGIELRITELNRKIVER